MKWQQRCVIDRCKSLIPGNQYLRRWKHDLCGFRSDVSRGDCAVSEGLLQLEWMKEILPIQGAVVLEIGSGWEPIIPLIYVAAGARHVYLTDLHRLCSAASGSWAVETLVRNRERILEVTGDEANFARAVSLDPRVCGLPEFFARLGLTYLAPSDCRRMPQLQSESLDVVTSRAVLEHIPEAVIEAILPEMRRLLKPDGLMFHAIDPADHWSYGDNSVSKVNFLRYSDFAHGLIHTSLNYQNRLRRPDYSRILLANGFDTIREELHVDRPSLEALTGMTLAPRFQGVAPEDLATTNIFWLGRRADTRAR